MRKVSLKSCCLAVTSPLVDIVCREFSVVDSAKHRKMDGMLHYGAVAHIISKTILRKRVVLDAFRFPYILFNSQELRFSPRHISNVGTWMSGEVQRI